ncbi:PA2169 family four-helix-bundle protein [Tamlana crocina]
MNTYTKEVGKQLNELLQKTYHTQKGFKTAAKHVGNDALESYFKLKAQERHNFGDELTTEFKLYNHPVNSQIQNEHINRAWMDVSAIVSYNDEESMLEEVIKGEKAAVSEYVEIIKNKELPISTKMVMESQKSKIVKGLSRFRTLEELC